MAHQATAHPAVSQPAPTMAKEKVLLIEDDPDIRELVQYNLEREGYSVLLARDGEIGLREATNRSPDAILLDIMMPGMDGLEVCRRLRADRRTVATPIIMLTARSEETDVVLGLELGADDYIPKPFSPRELLARVRAVLRRARQSDQNESPSRIERGPICLDSERHEVTIDGQHESFTRAEFRLLWALMSRPGRVFPRAELVDLLTDGEGYILERNIDVHVSAIRRKLGDHANWISTVRGVGYKCRDD